MKIRIITFQRTNNCGAALQAYALLTFLKRIYKDVKIVDYWPEWVQEQQKGYSLKSLFKDFQIKKFLLYPHRNKQNKKFSNFVKKYCDITTVVQTPEEISKNIQCDAFIVGSDQIWNPEITKGMDRGYFLQFSTEAKKIAYAASCGKDNMDRELLDTIVELIKDFDAVSVREKNLADAINDRENDRQRVVSVWDPVFLLNKEDYLKIAKEPKIKRYLLIYAMHDSEELRKAAKIVAQKENLIIVDTSKILKRWPADHVKSNIGPIEFLGLIANASYVITNSFHGTAFSIIFRKNFYCLEAGNRSVRLQSLLEDAGLTDRFLVDLHNLKKIEQVDYNRCEDSIKKYEQRGKEFLKTVI